MTAGRGGGGGASILYPMPSWQTAPGVISTDTRSTCGAANDQPCLKRADVSFDANPNTGYIIYSGGKWRLFGGTSAGAPLLAAIIADADTYSISHGGRRMGGSANPFFYAHAGAPLFRDITVGSNNIYGLPDLYPASAGYDMATGLGAPSGAQLAQLLLADTQGATADQTTLTGTESATVITPAAGTTFHGTLTDQTTGASARRALDHHRQHLQLYGRGSELGSQRRDRFGRQLVCACDHRRRAHEDGLAGVLQRRRRHLVVRLRRAHLVRAAVLDPGRHGDLDGKLLQRRPRCHVHREGAEHAEHGGKTADRADARRDRDGVEGPRPRRLRSLLRTARTLPGSPSPRPAGSTCGSATPARRKGRGRARFRRKSCSSSPEP